MGQQRTPTQRQIIDPRGIKKMQLIIKILKECKDKSPSRCYLENPFQSFRNSQDQLDRIGLSEPPFQSGRERTFCQVSWK